MSIDLKTPEPSWSRAFESGLLELMPVATVAYDRVGRVLRSNPRAAELFGGDPAQIELFDDAAGRFQGDEKPSSPVIRAIRTGTPQRQVELSFEQPSGRRVHVQVSVDPVRDETEEVAGALACFTELSAPAQSSLARALPDPDQRYRQLLEALPSAVYTTDAEGCITFYNKAAVELSGREPTPGSDRWCVTWRLYHPDGAALPHDQCPMAVALKERRPIRGVEAVAERPDGSRVPILPYPTPLFDGDGEMIGAINMLVDISDRKRAEEYASRLASIVEHSDDAIVSKDLNGIINSWNAGAERLFGYAPEEAIGKPIYILIPPDRHDEEPDILERIRRGERIDHYETVRRRKDGRLVDISLTVSPLKDAQGRIVGASKIARDISERKREEQRRTLLINELNHRVKNTLATVQSISRTLHGSPGRPPAEFEERVIALSRAHDVLTRESWEGADLRDVAGEVMAPICVDLGRRVEILGPPLWVRPRIALSLSMAFHELCTNAVKHGALGYGGGRAQLGWRVGSSTGGERLHVRWEETGGSAVKPPSRRGFGTELLERGVARELGAEVQLQFLPGGVVCDIEAPLQ